jgi:hypothetical protein
MALLLDALGRRDEAFAELERARRENSATLFLMNVDVRGEELRKDPRFKPLLRRVFGGGNASQKADRQRSLTPAAV